MKRGFKLKAEELRRSSLAWQVIERNHFHDDSAGSLITSCVMFLRYDYGKRYLTFKRFRKGFVGLFLFTVFSGLVYFLEPDSTAPIYYQKAIELKQSFLLGTLCMVGWLVAYTVTYIIHIVRRGAQNFQQHQIHSLHSGTSILRPFALRWLRFANWLATLPQHGLLLITPRSRKFRVRREIFYNDVRVTRRFLEPLLMFIVGGIALFFYLFPVTLWAVLASFSLRKESKHWLANYREHFDNLVDEELESHAVHNVYAYQKPVESKKKREKPITPSYSVRPEPKRNPQKTNDDFSLDDAFHSLNIKKQNGGSDS